MTKRKDANKQNDRENDLPNLLHHRPMGPTDISIIQALRNKLEESGVLEKDPEKITPDDLSTVLFSEATDVAKSEKELNSNFYRPEVEELVSELERSIGDEFDNPSLDGVDDYGAQVYKNSLEDLSDEY